MYWQSNGDYLAVNVDRYTKTKKSTYTGFELFRIKERDIPIEVLELENKNDKIIAFAWEPKGHRFAIIHGDNPKPDVSIYSMKTAQNTGRVSKLTTLKGKQANALFWSPAGRFIVLAGLKGFNGQLEFYNVDELETMATAEHFMATDVEWDPTGRYMFNPISLDISDSARRPSVIFFGKPAFNFIYRCYFTDLKFIIVLLFILQVCCNCCDFSS